jgi:hypothetical protein
MDPSTDTDIKNLILNLLGGFIVIFSERIYLFIKKHYVAYKFKMLFGNDIKNKFYIVYGKLHLDKCYAQNGIILKYPYQKGNGTKFTISEPISFTETKSAKYLFESFYKNAKSSPILISDEEIKEKINISYCSLGGYNNYKTIDILKSNKVFNINLRTKQISSKIDNTSYTIDNKYDYALVIKLRNIHFPNRVQICIAGLGESGTSGAAWFVANKWKEITHKIKKNDFICVIRVEFNEDESAEIVDLRLNESGSKNIISNNNSITTK